MIVKPASAIGGPRLEVKSIVYEDAAGESRSMLFEYRASDCQVAVVALSFGHIPPNT